MAGGAALHCAGFMYSHSSAWCAGGWLSAPGQPTITLAPASEGPSHEVVDVHVLVGGALSPSRASTPGSEERAARAAPRGGGTTRPGAQFDGRASDAPCS